MNSQNNNLRVSHRYQRLSDWKFNLFAASVVVGLTNNPAYPNPLVPLFQLAALQTDFQDKLVASDLGGRFETAAKLEARKALADGLRRQGLYVQATATGMTVLLSSGYLAASRNRAQSPLVKPWIKKTLTDVSGQLTLRVSAIANARNYQVQFQVGDGPWQEAGYFTDTRRMVVPNLTPGTVYHFRVRALGGSTKASPWSNVVSQMSL